MTHLIALALALLVQDETPQEKKLKVAVLPLNTGADDSKYVIKSGDKKEPIDKKKAAAALYDHLVTTLVKGGRFDVVENAKVDEILKQQQLNDLSKPEDVQSLGNLLGAQYLLQGSLTMLTASVSQRDVPNSETYAKRTTEAIAIMDLRVLDVSNGKILFATSHKQPATSSKLVQKSETGDMTGAVNDLIAQAEHELLKMLVRRLVDALFPIKIIQQKENVVYLNRGKDGLAEKDELMIVVRGAELRDPDSNAIVGYEETEIAKIRVVSVDVKMSKAEVVEWKSAEKTVPAGAVCRKLQK